MKLHFIIPAVPVPMPRPRVAVIHGRARVCSNPVNSPITTFKAVTASVASTVHSGPPLDEPLKLTAVFVLPRPKNLWFKTRAMPRVPHIKRGDLDNYVKGLKDALSGVVWRDDCLICEENLIKVIASGDESPHVEVTIETFNEKE